MRKKIPFAALLCWIWAGLLLMTMCSTLVILTQIGYFPSSLLLQSALQIGGLVFLGVVIVQNNRKLLLPATIVHAATLLLEIFINGFSIAGVLSLIAPIWLVVLAVLVQNDTYKALIGKLWFIGGCAYLLALLLSLGTMAWLFSAAMGTLTLMTYIFAAAAYFCIAKWIVSQVKLESTLNDMTAKRKNDMYAYYENLYRTGAITAQEWEAKRNEILGNESYPNQ